MSPSNQLFSAFSFIGFVMCSVPFYWHLEAWNTGTCLFMGWTALGCLLDCINSIVWNNNMVIRAPVYCDIATRIQIALNTAIPASSLCINLRLYRIATIKTVTISKSEKRRAVIIDLLIGLGLPILQIIAEYMVSYHRFTIFEDVGPIFSNALVIETIFLFSLWPLAIGCVSLVFCVLTIYSFFKRQRQFSQVMSSNRNLNRSRYFRLMALAACEILCTIPLGSYVLSVVLKEGLGPWKSWSATHNGDNYSRILQIPASVWKDIPDVKFSLEASRWFLVMAAFIFFTFFGFADEARQHYRLAYKSLATRVGLSTSSLTLQGSSHATSSLPYMRNKGEVSVSVVTTRGNKRDSMDSFADRLSIPSISLPSDDKPDIKIVEYSPTDTMASSSSMDSLELGPQGTSHVQVVTLPAVPPASVPPLHADSIEVTVRAYSNDAGNAV
ncbi:pheromone A receptor-domain-containing protein [Russula emetica]|nr:pheromone A receptor-domain-containing protein [Russula emetica]